MHALLSRYGKVKTWPTELWHCPRYLALLLFLHYFLSVAGRLLISLQLSRKESASRSYFNSLMLQFLLLSHPFIPQYQCYMQQCRSFSTFKVYSLLDILIHHKILWVYLTCTGCCFCAACLWLATWYLSWLSYLPNSYSIHKFIIVYRGLLQV